MRVAAIRPGPGIGRRALASAAAALALLRPARGETRPGETRAGPGALNLPPGNALGFRILRDGSEVGSHRIAFERRDTTVVAHIAIDIAVRYGWLTLYRFAHRATETWQGDRFGAIESHSDETLGSAWMRAAPADGGGGLLVSGSGTAPYAAPPGALASTYWNPAMLAAPMISSQDGKLSLPHVRTGPVEAVDCAGGSVQARRHELRGDLEMDVWYDLTGQWAHLRFRRDGAVITYLRL